MEGYLWFVISEAKPRGPRILIARFSALGDIVTMQPLVTAMRRRFGEDAVLDLVCLSRCAEAAKLLSEVNQIHVVERGTGEVLEALRERNFDYLMDFHGNVRSRSLARSLDVLTFTVDKQAWNRWRLIKGFRSAPVTSFIERCFECLQPFDVELPSQERWGPDAWGHINLTGHPDIAELTRGQVVISLGSSHPGKHLSHTVLDAAIQAAQPSNRSVVLVGGHPEQTRAEMLAEQHDHVVSRAGQWTLAESALAIQHADAVVSGDTVTMHLAAAVGTPLASVWGCTRPSLGLSAWRPHPQSLDLTPPDNHGRPCSKHGATCRHTRSSDPFHPDRCAQHVSADDLAGWMREVLK